MDDVFCEIVFAVGDENLLAGNQVTLAFPDRLGPDLGQIGAGLGLSQDWQKIRDTMSAVKADDLNVKATGPELGELVRQEQIRRIGELG